MEKTNNIKYKLNRSSKKPLYKQLYNQLKTMIASHDVEPGDTFYSENQLLEMFDVSRITVRSALQLLEDEGYLIKSQGSGSVVVDQNKYSWNLYELTDDLRLFEDKLITKVLSVEIVSATKAIKQNLQLVDNANSVYRIERLRIVRDKIMARSISYLPTWLSVNIDAVKAEENFSTTEFLRNAGENPFYVEETLEAINADLKTSKLLEIPENTAVFYRERVTFDETDKPLEYVISYYNSKNTKYHIKNKLL